MPSQVFIRHLCCIIFFMKTFGDKIKELREEKGLSILALSKLLDVNDRTVGRWEKGICDITSNLIKLSLFFDVTSDYLLGLEDEYGNKIKP